MVDKTLRGQHVLPCSEKLFPVRAGSCDTRVKHHNPVFIGRKTVLKMTRSLGQNTAVITFGNVIYTAKQEISNGNVQMSSQILRIPYGTDFFCSY